MCSPTAGRSCTTGMPSAPSSVRVADATELQQLRRVERAAAQDDLAAVTLVRVPPRRVPILHADRPRAVEQHAMHERPGRDRAGSAAVHHRVQVGAGGAQPPAAADVAVELGEALLPVAVDVVGERVAGLLHRFEEGAEQRVGRRPALEHERPAVAAELVGRRPPGRSPSA